MVWDDLKYTDRTQGPYGKLDTSFPVAFNVELHHQYQNLIKMRHAHPALRQGDFQILHTDDDTQTFAFLRSHGGDQVLVAFNRGRKETTIGIEKGIESVGSVEPLTGFLGEGARAKLNGHSIQLTLPPLTGFAWMLNRE